KKIHLKKSVVGVLLLVLFFFLCFCFLVFTPVVKKQSVLYIPTQANFTQVCDSLHAQKGVGNLFVFRIIAKCRNYDHNIKAGRYVLDRGMRSVSLLQKLRNGDQDPVKLKLHTIRTLNQLAGRIAKQMEVDSLTLLHFLQDEQQLATYKIGDSALNAQRVMAVFIPDTYFLNWNLNASAIFERLFKEQEKFWDAPSSMASTTDSQISRRELAKAMKLNPIAVLTVASIVEEETNYTPEKSLVASVYVNRLRKGMLLQADPTVKFALGDFALRRIRSEHTSVDSPYNTYRYKGLPPGPICMPSISSIDAVLSNAVSPYYYFCAKADFSGSHSFAANIAEHIQNARAYHRALNQRKIK
ncbi:MAG: endolytic transglycosylase MltG, partial [Bacteroidales bacterium]